MAVGASGERIKQAREIRGIKQSELALAIGVDQSYLSYLEAGLREPSEETVQRVALATKFPPAFFKRDMAPEFPLGSLLFRRRESLVAVERDRLRQVARLGYELFESMAGQFKPIEMHLPRLSQTDPAKAAGLARVSMALSPDTPITHLINRLERNGVFILLLPLTVARADGFSVWADSELRRPVIVLTGGWPGDRQRFSVAHELGHLVMHQVPTGSVSEMDSEADEFAADFLIPSGALASDLESPVTLTLLAKLKSKWGVSMQAIARQAERIGAITEGQRKYLEHQMVLKGWIRDEPVKIGAEKPRLFRKMAEAIYGIPTNCSRVAALISAPVKLVQEIMDAHASQAEVARFIAAKPVPVPDVETTEDTKVIQFRPRKIARG
jgi:Zn-dependent peptidase ImmA (M78 family)/DNA-binding XRE family transcriptional regulator